MSSGSTPSRCRGTSRRPKAAQFCGIHFGITLDDEQLEGMALLPGGTVAMFNTEWGLEADLPSTPVPDATRPRIAAAFVAHLEETGDLG